MAGDHFQLDGILSSGHGRRPSLGWCRLCLTLFLALGLRCSSATVDRLDIQLTVRDGYLAADPASSRLQLSPAYLALLRPSPDPAADLRLLLLTEVDRLLKSRGRVVDQLLGAAARDDLRRGRLDRASFLAGLDRTNLAWKAAVTHFSRWRVQHRDRMEGTMQDVHHNLLGAGALDDAWRAGPLRPAVAKDSLEDAPENESDQDHAEPSEPVDLDRLFLEGQLPLLLRAAPLTERYLAASAFRPSVNLGEFGITNRPSRLGHSDERPAGNQAASDPGVITGRHLRRPLLRWAGQPWFRDRLVEPLADYFAMRGYAARYYDPAAIEGSADSTPPFGVGLHPKVPRLQPDGRVADERYLISPDPLLVGVFLRIPATDLHRLRLALYLLLPTEDYRRLPEDLFAGGALQQVEDPFAPTAEDSGSAPAIAHLDLQGEFGRTLRFSRTFLTQRFLSERLRFLGAAALTASLVNEAQTRDAQRLKSVELLIAPAPAPNAAPSAPEAAPGTTFATPNLELAPLTGDAATNTLSPQSFESELSHRDALPARVPFEPDHPNLFRVGVEHSPRKELRYFTQYTRVGLAGPDALSAEAGFQQQPLGRLSYHRDFLGFDTLDQRLTLGLTALSEFEPDRLANGQSFDERRTGGSLQLQWELLRDWHGHWLRLDLTTGYREATSEREERRFARERLLTGDLGLLYLRAWDGTPHSARLEIEPRLRVGHSDAQDRGFVVPEIHLSHHQFVGAFHQWDLRLRGAWASDATPERELPSFGGEESVRGYREDAGLGRTAWSIQNEYWIPVRLRPASPSPLLRLLRQNLALAAFVDVGGVHDTSDAFSGIKAGAGLGVRAVWQDSITLRLDWAHALDDSSLDRGGSMFYLTMTTRQGF
ncbi:MAG: hypothetical protein IT580_08140 [Verrucomicrobiales bacterium]|nr:hypothetical protein [Verrucomicrobiales bacterium]